MKKSIIAAGAASVALAAMPIVGAFADPLPTGPYTDIIQTTVADSCTFARGTVADHSTTAYHPTGTWDVNKDETGTTTQDTDTLNPAVAVTPGAAGASATETPLGSSAFYVICNDTDGYQVTVATSSLTNGVPSQTTLHPWNYVYNGDATSASASYWKIESNDADADHTVDLEHNIVSKRTSAEDGNDFVVTYKAFAITGQDSGTYKATATYNFAQLPSA